MDELERIAWPDLLEQLRAGPAAWRQGQHVVTIGETGSDKTTLLSQLVPLHAHVVVFVTKTFDRSFSRTRWPGWTKLSEWDARTAAQSRHVLLWPRAQATIEATVAEQRRVFAAALDEILRDRGWTVVIDELQWVVDELALGRAVRTYVHQGRSSGITVVSGLQRPSHVPVVVYGAASHVFVARQAEVTDVRRLAELGGLDPKSLAGLLRSLPRRTWLHLSRDPSLPGARLTTLEV